MNNVNLIGRLTKDVELKYSQSATPIAISRYTLAVPRLFKREGEPDADFIYCKTFGKPAEFAEKYLKKGMQIGVTGRIQVTNYTDNSNNKRTITEIIVTDHTFCSSSNNNTDGNSAPAPSSNTSPGANNNFFVPMEDDDDLPF